MGGLVAFLRLGVTAAAQRSTACTIKLDGLCSRVFISQLSIGRDKRDVKGEKKNPDLIHAVEEDKC